MPSKSVLEAKQAIVAELSERLKASCVGVVVSYKGINVEDDTKLRKELRENGVNYTVVKNTLLRRATAEAGLSDFVRGQDYTLRIAAPETDGRMIVF